MAKIYAPNFTQIPNVIFDYWMNILTGEQFKVLLFIARKTFGWHKDMDRISIKQIEKATGISNRSVTRSLSILNEHGLIEKYESTSEFGDRNPNSYRIKVNEGGSVCETQRYVCETEPPASKTEGGSVCETPPILKEKNTKERIDIYSALEKHGKHVELSKEDLAKLNKKFGEERVAFMIEKINDYIDSKGIEPYEDYAATIRNWFRNESKYGGAISTQPGYSELNKRHAERVLQAFPVNHPHKPVLGNDYIEFCFGMKSEVLKFSDNGFPERLDSILKKMNIVIERGG